MKVLALLGSPRKNGNTGLLLDEYIKGIKETGNSAEITKIYLNDKSIHGCNACEACRNISPGQCAIEDDMQELYPLFRQADTVIYATPIYWWGVTAQLKAFMDRCYALGKVEGCYKGKKVSLLMTYGGDLPNSGPELVKTAFEDICEYKEMDLIHVYGACTDDYMPVAQNTKALAEVHVMGSRL